MHCESEALVKSAQFVIIIQTQMQANSGRLLCMPPGLSCPCSYSRVATKSETRVEMLAYTFVYKAYMASFVLKMIYYMQYLSSEALLGRGPMLLA